MEQPLYTITQASERLGVSVRKIKYYCGLGLVPGIKRTRSGYRELTEEQINHLSTLLWLRRCGFKMSAVRKYAALQRQGNATNPQRVAILATKKRQLWQDYEELQAQIDFLERQISWLESEQIQGQPPHPAPKHNPYPSS